MHTVADTRRARLNELILRFKTIAALNTALDLTRTDATLSQIRNQAKHSRTGAPRTMGDTLARSIEEKLKLPKGWMDTPPGGAVHTGEPPTPPYLQRPYQLWPFQQVTPQQWETLPPEDRMQVEAIACTLIRKEATNQNAPEKGNAAQLAA